MSRNVARVGKQDRNLVAFSQRLPEKHNDKNFGREEGTPIYGQESGCEFKGYRLCRRPLQRLMIAGLKQLMKFILDGLVGAGGREDQAKMH